MKKTIAKVIIILTVITAALFLVLIGSSGKTGKKNAKQNVIQKTMASDEAKGSDEKKPTSRDILDEIKNIDAADGGSKDTKTKPERHEISRSRYEECGHETELWMIKYSDGSYEIYEEWELPD